MNYNPAGLDRLYQAVKHQAECDLLEAINREYPGMDSRNKIILLSRFRKLGEKAEQRISVQAEQSKGK